MLAAFGAVPFGAYYYLDHLAVTPPWLWPLIPDSPIAAGLYGGAILLRHLGRPKRLLDTIASVLMAKIGMWTVFVLLFHWEVYFTPTSVAIRVPILVTHALMVPMGFIPLSARAPVPRRAADIAVPAQLLSALLILDTLDYSIPTHPWVPAGGLEYVAAAAVFSSVAAVGLVALATTRRNKAVEVVAPGKRRA
jgi:uncharacterized membrane protein YpjA